MSTTLSDTIPKLLSTGFFDRAASALREVLLKDPGNEQAWKGLVQVCRAQGDLQGAREACGKYRGLHPEGPDTAQLYAILSAGNLPHLPIETGGLPCPFVRIEGFFGEEEHATLLALVTDQYYAASQTGVEDGALRPEIRLSRRTSDSIAVEVKSWFAPRIRKVLPEILPRILHYPITIGRIELEVTMHGDGDFYTVHTDEDDTNEHGRRISYAYYFHRSPKRFIGGDLLLYDSDVMRGLCQSGFTRIEPRDNTILFFPSLYFHQVTPILCETADYRDGRFAVNGWLHAVPST